MITFELFIRWRRRRRRRFQLWLWVNRDLAVHFNKQGVLIMRDLRLDQSDILTLSGRDHKGNRIIPVFDSAPVWKGSDDAVATIAPQPDGSAIVTPVALGAMNVSVVAVIGGNSYSAALDITIMPGAIVGIDINESISPA